MFHGHCITMYLLHIIASWREQTSRTASGTQNLTTKWICWIYWSSSHHGGNEPRRAAPGTKNFTTMTARQMLLQTFQTRRYYTHIDDTKKLVNMSAKNCLSSKMSRWMSNKHPSWFQSTQPSSNTRGLRLNCNLACCNSLLLGNCKCIKINNCLLKRC